jgi:hypothetical protein
MRALAVITACGIAWTTACGNSGDEVQPDAASADGADTAGDVAPDAATDTADADAKKVGIVYANTSSGPPCVESGEPKACWTACEPAQATPVQDVNQKPDPAKCSFESSFQWLGGTAPKPTLQVELGTVNPDTGGFSPYHDGQWAPIVHGVQGGVHVWATFRTDLPGFTGAKTALEVGGQAYLECQSVATELSCKPVAFADPAMPGKYTTAAPQFPPTPVAFDQTIAGPYCGRWIVLYGEVRLPGTDKWGFATQVLRLYDLANPL